MHVCGLPKARSSTSTYTQVIHPVSNHVLIKHSQAQVCCPSIELIQAARPKAQRQLVHFPHAHTSHKHTHTHTHRRRDKCTTTKHNKAQGCWVAFCGVQLCKLHNIAQTHTLSFFGTHIRLCVCVVASFTIGFARWFGMV